MESNELNKIMDEIMELYKTNRVEELVRIRDDENEIDGKRLAANLVLQMPRDPRRYY